MPTYVYACTSCGDRLEAVQRITDDPLTICPACSGALRKVIQPVGIVFKGSGFYKTDSRGSANGSRSDAPAGGDKTSEKSADKVAAPASAADKPTATTATPKPSGSESKSPKGSGSSSGTTKPAAATDAA